MNRDGHLEWVAAPPTNEARRAPRQMDESAWDALTAMLQATRSPTLSGIFTVPQRLGQPSGWWGHVPFAGWLVEATQPRLLVELGTHHGVSYAAMCEAVRKGRLPTRCFAVDHWRGDPHSGPSGDAIHADLQAFNALHYGAFSELIREDFDSAAQRFEDGSIDLLHIDGFHSYEAVRHDYEHWLPKLSDRAVVIFHDTNVRRDDFGVHRLFAELAAGHPHFEFLHGHGLGVLAVGVQAPPAILALCGCAQTPAALEIRDGFAAQGSRWETLARLDDAQRSFSAQVQALNQAHQQALERVQSHAKERRDAVLLAHRERDAALGRVYLLQTRLEEAQADLDQMRERFAAHQPEVSARAEAKAKEAYDALARSETVLLQLREQLAQSQNEKNVATARAASLADTLERTAAQREQLAHELALSGEQHERARTWASALLEGHQRLSQNVAQFQAQTAHLTATLTQMIAALLTRHEELVGTPAPQQPLAVEPATSAARQLWRRWRPRQIPAVLNGLRPWASRWRSKRHAAARMLRKSMLFDSGWYLATYPDVRDASVDPVYHYAVHGAREGRDPGPWFSTQRYLAQNPDVATAGINALYHFEAHGLREGRPLAPVIDALVRPPAVAGHAQGVSAQPREPRPAQSHHLNDARQHLIATLQAELDRFLANGERLQFGSTAAPTVSVILVLYNQAALTYGCLRALQAIGDVPFELVVVDNASTDQTTQLLDRLDGCQVLRQTQNLHFLRAANLGARHASGRHLLFLNNDTQVDAASLGMASRLLDETPDAGAVGGAIVLPEGRLQEAGSIIWRDGSCQGYGRGDDPDAPAYAFQRDVDYCSGAFLMVPRRVFDKLGGFDPLFAPAYYEDTDLCMRIRAAGLRVIYEPRVRLLHVESASAPTAQTSVALMQANQEQFVRRHAETLAHWHLPVGDAPFLAAMRLLNRGRVLFVDDHVPDPAIGAGNGRAAALLRCLHEANVFVTHCALATPTLDLAAARAIVPATVELVPGGVAGLRRLLSERAGFYDAVIVSRPHNMAHWKAAVEFVPQWPAQTPVIYDAEAIFALRDDLRRHVLGEPSDLAQSETALQQELALVRNAQVILAVNEAEATQFRRAGGQDVRVLGHAVPRGHPGGDRASRKDFLFIGRLAEDDSPNADSIRWFVNEVMPHLDRMIGDDYGIDIVGMCYPRLAQTLGGPRVRFHGRVDDLAPWYEKARVFIAPTRFAAGIPLKVHEAAAHGVPVVATDLLAHQLGWRDGLHLLEAEVADADGFASACARAHDDAALWERLRQEALARVAHDCDPAHFRSVVTGLLGQFVRNAAAEKPAATVATDMPLSAAQAQTVQTWSTPPEQRVEEQGLFWMEHPLVTRRLNHMASGSPDRDGLAGARLRLAGAGWSFPVDRMASLGCGFGGLECVLATSGWARHIDGYDLAPAAVAAAREAAAARGLDSVITYHVCDLERQALPQAAFDIVVGHHSVHHIQDLDALFASVNRALRPGGIFLLQEYVGPDRFQWTDAQLGAINDYLASLPERYRRLPSGFDFRQAGRPSVEAVIAVDPSEAIRSSAILPTLERHFKVVERRDLGGALLHPALSGIAQNFDPDRAEDAAHLQRLFDLEDRLMAEGVVGSDFVVVIAERKDDDG